MKTKTKTIVLVEIAIVLCSILLVSTLPAIAADQTDEPLGIHGNANEDDTIDMRDTTYIKLAIFGKKPKTDLADANYDGKVSMLDVGQAKLIILGKEKRLTLIDCDGETVTVCKPVKRIIACYYTTGETIRALGAKDRVVGIDNVIQGYGDAFFPEMAKKPCVGHRGDLDIEKILDLEPDIIILGSRYGYGGSPGLEDTLKGTGIVVVRGFPYKPESVRPCVMKLGYVLDGVENAREYFEWQDKYVERINEKVSEIPEYKKMRVFVEDSGGTITERKISGHVTTCEQAGGIQLGADLYGAGQKLVEVEWIIEQNPDVIVGGIFTGGYKTDDDSTYRSYYEEIRGLPGFDQIKAVQDDRVYIMTPRFAMGLATPIGTTYMAKWFYPDLFEDLDPQEMHQEYVDTFCPGLDFDVREHGVFVYPKPAW